MDSALDDAFYAIVFALDNSRAGSGLVPRAVDTCIGQVHSSMCDLSTQASWTLFIARLCF